MPAVRSSTKGLRSTSKTRNVSMPDLSGFKFMTTGVSGDASQMPAHYYSILGDVVDLALESKDTVHYPTNTSERETFRTKEGNKVTAHQWAVYDAALKIPCGKVTTYGGLCTLLGGGSPRSVGSALRKNPFAPRVPCHRVISSDLSLGGFFGEWGTEGNADSACRRKLEMLAREGVCFSPGTGKLEERESVLWNVKPKLS